MRSIHAVCIFALAGAAAPLQAQYSGLPGAARLAQLTQPIGNDLLETARSEASHPVLARPTSIRLEDAPLDEALKAISAAGAVSIAFSEEVVAGARRVTLDSVEEPLLHVLRQALHGSGAEPWVSRSGQVVIVAGRSGSAGNRYGSLPTVLPRIARASTAFSAARLLQGAIAGRVVAASTGEPLAGVQVVVLDSRLGAVTGADGSYRIAAVPAGTHRLRAVRVGYSPVERSVTVVDGQSATVDLALTAQVVQLEGVVAVGYGTQERRNVTGAVSSVDAEMIEDLPVLNIDRALAGQVPGVQVKQTSGAPGSGLNITVRGQGSISAGNQPLYVIDGFPLEVDYHRDNNPLNFLNPNDVESIQVLKDASAAAIYGSRAANGVVLITTKTGRAGTTNFEVDVQYGMQDVLRRVEVLGGREWAEGAIFARNRGYLLEFGKKGALEGDSDAARAKRSGNTLFNVEPLQNFLATGSEGTDWQDLIFRSAPIQSYQLSARGGTDNVRYFVGGGFEDQRGVVVNSGFRRYSFRTNVTADLGSRMQVGANLAPSLTNLNNVTAEGRVHNAGVIASALLAPPVIAVLQPDGTYTSGIRCCTEGTLIGHDGGDYNAGFQNIDNPLNKALNWKKDWQNHQMLGTAYAQYRVTDEMDLRSTVGGNVRSSTYQEYRPSTIGEFGSPPPLPARGSYDESLASNWINTNQLTFGQNFADRHDVEIMVAQEAQYATTRFSNIDGENFPTDVIELVYDRSLVTNAQVGSTSWSLLAFFGRLDYSFDERYLFQLNLRRDGSSRFGADRRWGTFPSASLGWVVSEEPFFQGVPGIGRLKLRASYGVTGNNDIGNYAALGLMQPANYALPTGVAPGFALRNFSSPNLTWETQRQFDVGADTEFFGGRLGLTVDYYEKINSDLLLQVPIPNYTGLGSEWQNIGEVLNRGFEVAARTRTDIGAFQWDLSMNLAANRNKVLRLGPGATPIRGCLDSVSCASTTRVGRPFGEFVEFLTIGVFRDSSEITSGKYALWPGREVVPGDPIMADANGDGVISEDDQTVLGSPWPDFTYGATSTMRYGRFDLGLMLQGSQGGKVMNGLRFGQDLLFDTNEFPRFWRNSWRSPEQPGDGRMPGATRSTKYRPSRFGNFDVSTALEDASYVALRNVTLGVRLPERMGPLTAAGGARLYVSVQNALFLSPYSLFNPESTSTARGNDNSLNTLAPGVDNGSYPLARTLSIGANLSF